MKKEISPEEKLFNAIQEGKKMPPRKPVVSKSEPAGVSLGQKVMASFGLSPSVAGTATATGVKPQAAGPNIKLINRILSLVLIFLIALVVYVAIYERPSETKAIEAVEVRKNTSAVFQSAAVEEFKPVDFYLQEVQKKDIFHPKAPVVEVPVVEEVKPVETGPTIQDLMKNLSLAGIYEGQTLEAMIEDKELKKTYFVKEGDEFKGLKVKSILKDRVVLQMGTQEADLL